MNRLKLTQIGDTISQSAYLFNNPLAPAIPKAVSLPDGGIIYFGEGGDMGDKYLRDSLRHYPHLYEDRETDPKDDKPSWYIIIITLILALFALLICTVSARADVTAIETIAREASGESLEAQVYVGAVIRARMSARRLSAKEVCLQKWQFSCWNKGTHQKQRSKAELIKAKQAWELSKDIKIKPSHYFDTSITKPRWANKMILVKSIGRLRFYKEA